LVVELREDQVVGRRPHRAGHYPAAVLDDGEVRGLVAVSERVLAQPARQPEDQVVLGLARDEEITRALEELVRRVTAQNVHGTSSQRDTGHDLPIWAMTVFRCPRSVQPCR